MASGGGGKAPATTGEWNSACDSCRSAPGIPFCRVEWSCLCAGCAGVVHGQSWIVAVPPNPNPSDHSHSAPYPFPCLNPSAVPSPHAVVPQKRKVRTLEKTVRYRKRRRANAELMRRADGKFSRRSGGSGEAGMNVVGREAAPPDASEAAGIDAVLQ